MYDFLKALRDANDSYSENFHLSQFHPLCQRTRGHPRGDLGSYWQWEVLSDRRLLELCLGRSQGRSQASVALQRTFWRLVFRRVLWFEPSVLSLSTAFIVSHSPFIGTVPRWWRLHDARLTLFVPVFRTLCPRCCTWTPIKGSPPLKCWGTPGSSIRTSSPNISSIDRTLHIWSRYCFPTKTSAPIWRRTWKGNWINKAVSGGKKDYFGGGVSYL